mmetsp:Transcript_13195/g.17191  ORF Transcript_13195/g.17191 Transcript_13195/m.17191 type:complete len:96 (+) Transcript_13195:512-799(+)
MGKKRETKLNVLTANISTVNDLFNLFIREHISSSSRLSICSFYSKGFQLRLQFSIHLGVEKTPAVVYHVVLGWLFYEKERGFFARKKSPAWKGRA